jgi:hypothetical protein
MLDKDKVTTWIRGQVELDNGDLVRFEFSPDREHGGGTVCTEPAEGHESLLVTHKEIFQDASGILGTQLIKFLRSAKTMFSLVSVPPMTMMWMNQQVKPPEGSDR